MPYHPMTYQQQTQARSELHKGASCLAVSRKLGVALRTIQRLQAALLAERGEKAKRGPKPTGAK